MTPSVSISLALTTVFAKTMSVSNITVSPDSSVSQTTYSVAAPDSTCYAGDFRCERSPGEHIITYCLMAGSIVSCTVCSGKTCTMYEGARGSCLQYKECTGSRYCVGGRDPSFQPADRRVGCKMFLEPHLRTWSSMGSTLLMPATKVDSTYSRVALSFTMSYTHILYQPGISS
jgi:hypothetical protein